jgi:hypothetical protein
MLLTNNVEISFGYGSEIETIAAEVDEEKIIKTSIETMESPEKIDGRKISK